jgi:hypothetical protein
MCWVMQPELLVPEYHESEVVEKAIRRSDLIRKKYGTLANFLKSVGGTSGFSEPIDDGQKEPEKPASYHK